MLGLFKLIFNSCCPLYINDQIYVCIEHAVNVEITDTPSGAIESIRSKMNSVPFLMKIKLILEVSVIFDKRAPEERQLYNFGREPCWCIRAILNYKTCVYPRRGCTIKPIALPLLLLQILIATSSKYQTQ